MTWVDSGKAGVNSNLNALSYILLSVLFVSVCVNPEEWAVWWGKWLVCWWSCLQCFPSQLYTGCGYVVSHRIFQVFLAVLFTALNLVSRNATLIFTFSGSSHQHNRIYELLLMNAVETMVKDWQKANIVSHLGVWCQYSVYYTCCLLAVVSPQFFPAVWPNLARGVQRALT